MNIYNLNKEDLEVLQEVLNEEILNYLHSGYDVTSDYIVLLQVLLEKLGLKEIYNFDRR